MTIQTPIFAANPSVAIASPNDKWVEATITRCAEYWPYNVTSQTDDQRLELCVEFDLPTRAEPVLQMTAPTVDEFAAFIAAIEYRGITALDAMTSPQSQLVGFKFMALINCSPMIASPKIKRVMTCRNGGVDLASAQRLTTQAANSPLGPVFIETAAHSQLDDAGLFAHCAHYDDAVKPFQAGSFEVREAMFDGQRYSDRAGRYVKRGGKREMILLKGSRAKTMPDQPPVWFYCIRNTGLHICVPFYQGEQTWVHDTTDADAVQIITKFRDPLSPSI